MSEHPDHHSAQAKAAAGCHVQWQDAPPALYLNMTITRWREIEALYETLELFSRLLDEDD